MSDAYECDRCGACHPGAPHKTVGVGDGVAYQRTAPAIDREVFHDHGPGGPYTDAVDLCPGCWNDLKRWWVDGGGEVDQIGIERVDDPEGWDSDFQIDGAEVVDQLSEYENDIPNKALTGAVPNGRLRNLVKKWNDELADYPDDERGGAAYAAVSGCATELSNLIKEHTDE